MIIGDSVPAEGFVSYIGDECVAEGLTLSGMMGYSVSWGHKLVYSLPRLPTAYLLVLHVLSQGMLGGSAAWTPLLGDSSYLYMVSLTYIRQVTSIYGRVYTHIARYGYSE